MEAARELLVNIFEELTAEAAPPHPVFSSNDKVKAQELNDYELMESNGSAEVLAIKTLLRQKQQAIIDKESLASIAQLSFQIREANQDLDKIISQIESYSLDQKEDKQNILNFAASLRSAEETLRDYDMQCADTIQVKTAPEQAKLVTSTALQSRDDRIEKLDALLPEFESLEVGKQRYNELDKQIDDKVDIGIEKLQIIKNQVQEEKETQAVLDEKVTEVEKEIEKAEIDVKGIVRNTNDLRKKLMAGDKFLTIVIVIMIILIAAYWIYKLCF